MRKTVPKILMQVRFSDSLTYRSDMGKQIAIDGPAGAGKSTIAKMLAKELGFIYVDTGAMYRAIALYFLEHNTDEESEASVETACRDINISIAYEDGAQQVYLNGENVSGRIRTPMVSAKASKTSAIPQVRKALYGLQKKLADENDVVMDGRDIGTCILPEATLKIYLTASVMTRAKRRFDELKQKGQECILEDICKEIEKRDKQDMSREISPLKQADDALLLDSSDMTPDEVCGEIITLYRERI